MIFFKQTNRFTLILTILTMNQAGFLGAQDTPEIIRTISYREIFNAQMVPITGIEQMKISGDGGKIVFNTVGGELYTINTDGTGLTKLLAQDGRASSEVLAKKCKVTPSTIRRRLNELIRKLCQEDT